MAILLFWLEKLLASTTFRSLTLWGMCWARDLFPAVSTPQQTPVLSYCFKSCLSSASERFPHPHALSDAHISLPYDRCLYALLFPFSAHVPPRGMAWWWWLLWRYKMACHLEIKTTVMSDASPQRMVRHSVRSVIWDELKCLLKVSGVQKTREREFSSLCCLPPGLGSRRAEILNIRSDASMAPLWPWQQSYLQIQEMRHWNKKELSGTVQKQTQTEQDYHFAGNKTDCVSMSKSTQAIKS